MDEAKKKLMDRADELGIKVSKFWTLERIQLAVTTAENALPPKVVDETSSENSANQECPSNACQELQDEWGKDVKCYNPDSKYCSACEKDFPDTTAVCKAKTSECALQSKAAKSAPKASKTGTGRPSGRVKVGFGHVEGTQAAAIDVCLQAGMAKVDILKHINDVGLNKNALPDYDLWMRTMRHFDDLKKLHGITIVKDVHGIYKGTVA